MPLQKYDGRDGPALSNWPLDRDAVIQPLVPDVRGLYYLVLVATACVVADVRGGAFMSSSSLLPPARAAAFVEDWNTGLPGDKTIKMEIFDITEGLLIFAMILQVFAWLGMVAVQVRCSGGARSCSRGGGAGGSFNPCASASSPRSPPLQSDAPNIGSSPTTVLVIRVLQARGGRRAGEAAQGCCHDLLRPLSPPILRCRLLP